MNFQSHYGAIATKLLRRKAILSFSFQSHYGAIATCHQCNPPQCKATPFNPTMVRLQQSFWNQKLFSRSAFNPTMVRLQPLMRTGVLNARPFFQSHYGAIATCRFSMMTQKTTMPFNPTMVRLQRYRTKPNNSATQLSIPLWCDCNTATT